MLNLEQENLSKNYIMSEEVDLETRQIYLIGGGDGNTEVIITDLGEIGENAIIVFEENVGVGAEEIVANQEYVAYTGDSDDVIQEAGLLDAGIKSDLDLGIQYDGADVQYDTEEVTYESEVHVEDVHLGDTNVYFNVGLESESDHSEVLSLPSTSEETVTVTHLTHEQPLNLVKKDRKRKPSSIDGNTDVVICKLCNSYVVSSLIDQHNSDVHGNMDRLVCQDCGKLFTSKRSLFGHKKEKHSGPVEVFPCVDCGKNFSRKANLKAHRDSLHFGKKFPCSFCERIFTNRSSMNQHIKKTHTDPIIGL